MAFSLHQKLNGSLRTRLDHGKDRPLLRLHNRLISSIRCMLDTVAKIGHLKILQSL